MTKLNVFGIALLLLGSALAQEPSKHNSVKDPEPPKPHFPVSARGARRDDTPLLTPKPLPILHPSLAETARQARSARANSQHAQLVVESDDLQNNPAR